MENNNVNKGTRAAILLYLIATIMCIVMFFSGCTSTPSIKETTEKEESDEKEENDSIFFHEETIGSITGAREDDKGGSIDNEPLSSKIIKKPSVE